MSFTLLSLLFENNNLGGNTLTYNESEDAYYIQHGADSVPKKLGESEVVVGTVSGVDAEYAENGVTRLWKYYIGTGYRYVGLISHTGKYGNSIGSGDYKTYTMDISYDSDTGYMTLSFPVHVWEVSCSYIAIK